MALNWCWQEPWPTAANNSLIAYPNQPKPAYEQVQAACRPVLASAAFARFDWRAGETLAVDTWMLSDAPEAVKAGEMEVWLEMDGKAQQIGQWAFAALAPQQNRQGPTIRFDLPAGAQKQLIKVSLRVKGEPAYDSDYLLLLRAQQRDDRPVNRLNY